METSRETTIQPVGFIAGGLGLLGGLTRSAGAPSTDGIEMRAVRRRMERTINAFLASPSELAVLVGRHWSVASKPFVFAHKRLYRWMAAAAGCFIVTIERPVDGGTEHLLFLTRSEALHDEDYLDTLDNAQEIRYEL